MTKNRMVSAVVIIAITALVLFAGNSMLGSDKGIAAGLENGTYQGLSDAGKYPGLKVEVEVLDGRIIDVRLLSHNETEGLSDPAIAEIPGNIVAAQSTEIDGISGATLTSDAIKEAVEYALASQPGVKLPVEYADGYFEGSSDEGMHEGLQVGVEVEGGKIVSVVILDHNETDGISDPAIAEMPEAIVSANSTDVDMVSGATYTSTAIIDAVNKALASDPIVVEDIIPADRVYVDGIYEGESDEGMHAGLKVSVEIVDGKIASVKVIEHNETDGISDPAIAELPNAIVEANTPSVDGVSGASYTSAAIKEAVKFALEKAQ